MAILAAISGFLILGIILWDAFETIILPRRVTRRLRLSGHRHLILTRALWGFFEARGQHLAARCARRVTSHRRRTAEPPCRGAQRGFAGSIPARLGVVVGGADGEPSLLPGPVLFSLSAQ